MRGRLGAGGMGEVWRATDTRLGRDVALKVLPESLARDPDALERFEREARAVAALSHPNILAIHDVGREDGISFAVMELLEGETLRDKLAEGPLPQRKALEYAQQIAQGLAAAHARGIVHRDLKPENVFVTHDGRVKILDFGLAKQREAARAEDETSAPTRTRHTDPGTVMGTVGYMSPEQVKGQAADHRSDIFSFGALLYEMLSGQRAFKRDTAPETLTAILREDPPELTASNPRVEPALDRLVRHCLEKSPDERFQSARDLAYALSTLGSASSSVSGPAPRPATGAARRPTPATVAAIAAGLALGALAGRFLWPRPGTPPPSFHLLTYSGRDWAPSASRDGKTLAFVSDRDGVSRIWIKQVAGGAEAALTGGVDTFPRISPDGTTVLFLRDTDGGRRALYRVPIVGGEARKLAGPALEADWSPDGRDIAYITTEVKDGKLASSVHRIAADGTGDRVVGSVADRLLTIPRWSPDGTAIAALEKAGTGISRPLVALFPLSGGTASHLDMSDLDPSSSFAWNGNGRELIFMGAGLTGGIGSRDGGAGIGTATFGTRTRQVVLKPARGGASRVLLSAIDLRGYLDVLGDGALAMGMGGPRASLREVDFTSGQPGRWLTRGSCVDRQPVFAPDGEWVAFTSNRSGGADIWEVSTKSGAVRRLTEDPGQDFDPAFTHDGKHLLFSSNRSGHFEVWSAERDGSGARQLSSDGVDAENPSDTPDGQWVVYASGNPEKRGIWKVRADGTAATRLVAGPLTLPEISPDGTLLSYSSVAETPRHVRVVTLADGKPVPWDTVVEGKRANTGRHRWLPDGKALAIQVEDANGVTGVVVQDFAPGRDTTASRRRVAGFSPESVIESLGVSPDGTRLVVNAGEESAALLMTEGVPGIVGRTRSP